MADRGDQQARPQGDAERGEFRADPFPARRGQDRGRGRCVPHQARPGAARAFAITACRTALRMTIGTEEANRLVVEALREFMAVKYVSARSRLSTHRADRLRPDRRLDRARRGARKGLAERSSPPRARPKPAPASIETRLVDRVVGDQRGGREGCRSRHRLHPGRRLRRGRAGNRRASQAGRHRLRRRLGQGRGGDATWPRICRPACISFRRIRSPAPSIPGPDSGFAELFINRWCILTPPEGADADAVEKLARSGPQLGANVEIMTPDHHDLVLAITSHLPHLIAYTIVGTADELDDVTASEVLKFSAGGFRDFTRIAASDPTMWRDVFLPTRTRCWRCSAPSTRICRSSPARSAAATARRCSSTSPAPARSAGASSRSARIRRARLRPPARGAGQEGGVALFFFLLPRAKLRFARWRSSVAYQIDPTEYYPSPVSNTRKFDPPSPTRGEGRKCIAFEGISEQRRDLRHLQRAEITVPSTNRSGKDRAFLPSSMASVPSALMPAATPTLAFCFTTLPRPGIARSSAPSRLLTSAS